MRCDSQPGAQTPEFLDEHGRPIDMTDETSVNALAGHVVMMCATVRRERAGRVLDEATRAPIAGAVVVMESWQTPAPIGGLSPRRSLLATVEVNTDPQGNWRVPSERKWMQAILAADGFPYFIDSYCASAPGYATSVFDPWKQPDATDQEVMEIALRRSTGSASAPVGHVSRCGLDLEPSI
jgi:hypothetical protein